uniref:Cytochrome P450 family 8 subfamily B member 1 n=1 Tax=Sphenodon punctatus TaxID=8508 RepID=A0A8D0G475_SPHPU
MDFWVTVLCALLASILGGLYFVGAFRKRRPKEPPLDKGFIPWLGYGLDFRKNGAQFLQKMQKKHGDIFTVLIGGYYFTFVTDPHSFGAIVKEARGKLDFTVFAQELVVRVFGYQPTNYDHKLIESSSIKHLKGNGLVVMTQAMMENLQTVMLHGLGSKEENRPWQQDGLFHYSYNIVFRAGYLALFGNEPGEEKAKENDRAHSEDLFGEFRKYDNLFPRLAYAMLPPAEKKEAEQLKRLFWDTLAVKKLYQKNNISGWVSEQDQGLAENGTPEYMRDRFIFLFVGGVSGSDAGRCGGCSGVCEGHQL